MTTDVDVVIIGGGPVGIFTVFQAGLLGMKTCLIDSLPELGGQCTVLYPEKFIYDIPGYPKIAASELIEKLKLQAFKFNPTYYLNNTVELIHENEENFVIKTDKGKTVICKAIIIAAGAGAFDYNKLPISSAESFENHSLFYNVTDKNIFKNKVVAIAGGGDSAADWAIMLSDIAKKIYLIHRRSKFRCMDSSINQILDLKDKIEIITPYQIKDILGEKTQINEIILSKLNGEEKRLETDFLLAFFGLKSYLKNIENWGLEIKNHHIEVSPINYQTNIKNIYAIGDIATYENKLKLILCGFSESATVCHEIYKTVFANKVYNFKYSTNMEDLFS
jgi:thioredoxin reductase (NADPH)